MTDETAALPGRPVVISTSPRPYSIAHISDLHFGWGFDRQAWNYVKNLLIQSET